MKHLLEKNNTLQKEAHLQHKPGMSDCSSTKILNKDRIN